MNTIITVSTIMSMYMNLTTNVENSKFCYNADIENGCVKSIEVYANNGEYLKANLKRLYTYDDQNRLVKRETLKWNKKRMAWENHSCLCYNYSAEGYTVEKRFWDEASNNYGEAKEYSHYTILMDNVIAVNEYTKDLGKGEYALVKNTLIMTPDTSKLMATE